MAVVEVVAVLFLVLAAVVVLVVVLGPRVAWQPVLSRRVVVNLKSGRAVDGLLVKRSGDLLFLREATALEPGAEPARLDGSAVIARADVDFIQAL